MSNREPDLMMTRRSALGQIASTMMGTVGISRINVSRCGRFFCCDDWQGNSKIVIGSVETGRTAVVCEAKTSRSRPQNTHAHAYLTPNLKWVIFNSDRNGFPHVHAASVPDEIFQDILRT